MTSLGLGNAGGLGAQVGKPEKRRDGARAGRRPFSSFGIRHSEFHVIGAAGHVEVP